MKRILSWVVLVGVVTAMGCSSSSSGTKSDGGGGGGGGGNASCDGACAKLYTTCGLSVLDTAGNTMSQAECVTACKQDSSSVSCVMATSCDQMEATCFGGGG